MSRDQTFHSRNLLISMMSLEDRALLAPHLERVPIKRDTVLVAQGQPISEVYFPESGIASVTARSADGVRTEVGIFGREGVSGTPLLLGADRSPHDTLMRMNECQALRMGAAQFLEAVETSATLRWLMLRYVQTMVVQLGQSAVASSRYQIEGRLARWLLMCDDRVDGSEIALTHEFMAAMIGAQRSGVTVALHVLEGGGMIRSTRGRVMILDRAKLEELAGDSYGVAEKEYCRMIGPFGAVPA